MGRSHRAGIRARGGSCRSDLLAYVEDETLLLRMCARHRCDSTARSHARQRPRPQPRPRVASFAPLPPAGCASCRLATVLNNTPESNQWRPDTAVTEVSHFGLLPVLRCCRLDTVQASSQRRAAERQRSRSPRDCRDQDRTFGQTDATRSYDGMSNGSVSQDTQSSCVSPPAPRRPSLRQPAREAST